MQWVEEKKGSIQKKRCPPDTIFVPLWLSAFAPLFSCRFWTCYELVMNLYRVETSFDDEMWFLCDILVYCHEYMWNCMSGMQENRKKTKKNPALPSAEPSFAECWRGTRQSDQTFAECQHSAKAFFLKNFAECPTWHSAKNFSKKNAECLTRQHSAKKFSKKKFLCRVPDTSALGKGWRQVDGARYLCRVLVWHSANPLPSACHVALDKDSFADHFFAE